MKDERPLRIEFSTRFNKRRDKISPDIKTSLRGALELFIENPNHPQLRNHALKGKYSGYNFQENPGFSNRGSAISEITHLSAQRYQT